MKTVLLLFLPVTAHLLFGGSMDLLQRELMELPVAQYRTVQFSVPEYQAEDAVLLGDLEISPDTASLELILVHIDDYMRWERGAGQVDTLAYRKMGSGNFSMELSGLGDYVLVVSNRGNYRPATAVMNLVLNFSGSGDTGDPLPSAMRLALLLMMAGAVVFAIGSVLVNYLHRRKKRN
ncbi:MAG: hypothetical protein GF388_08745 [Candidatus Aegiribacteria sp.]|nr:hypothetical protein [Candidatus Aegiribacteria sp.]MBD3295164.1 hypothetical protein [Candidatus Fermentibacteria bacterium]